MNKKRIQTLNSKNCSLPNKVYGFQILKKNPGIFSDFFRIFSDFFGFFSDFFGFFWGVCEDFFE